MTKVSLSTSRGDILLELDEDKAPQTVANFLNYVNAGHYDGTIFHRVIPGFMIQGGGFDPDMTQRPTSPPVVNEASNGLRNDRGTIAMARTSVPDSATSQFFINLVDNHSLNYSSPTPAGAGYAVFGRVVGGMEVVDEIKSVATGSSGGHRDVPREPVFIEKASVVA